MSKPFHFKQFSLYDDKSTMKVGTDAVLLGVYAKAENPNYILDIGTGCGVISLMLAQKYNCQIHAIDIDKHSCIQATNNFAMSKWGNNLLVFNTPLQDFKNDNNILYDLIVANPPFFKQGIYPLQNKRVISRHEKTLNLNELFFSTRKLLSNNGTISLILPSDRATECMEEALNQNLYLSHINIIIPKEQLKPNRHILSFSKTNKNLIEFSHITLRSKNNLYTNEFKELVKEYYLDFPY